MKRCSAVNDNELLPENGELKRSSRQEGFHFTLNLH